MILVYWQNDSEKTVGAERGPKPQKASMGIENREPLVETEAYVDIYSNIISLGT